MQYTPMSPLMTIILIGMCLTFIENTLVAFIAIRIYFKQQATTANMEKRIETAIEDVKKHMTGKAVVGALKKDIKKTMNGWLGGKKSGGSRTINGIARGLGGGLGVIRELQKCKSFEEKALVIGEYAARKLDERKAKEATETKQDQQLVLTPEEFKIIKESKVTPEEYAKQFAEAVDAQGNESVS